MKLTTKGRFAVTAMLDIAMHAAEAGRPISIAQVSERQQISLPYLEQIFCRLRRAGLVESVRGPGGGYRLADRPEAITIDRIIKAVDENMDTSQCGGEGTCLGGAACLTHHLWLDLNGVIERFLAGISLASLVDQHEARHGQQTVAAVIGVSRTKTQSDASPEAPSARREPQGNKELEK
ncbi:Rrf2 family transcriptional regulator [Sutterella megalosphaeroides]|uniref:Fe-S cluster assembly transcriptional regulator IscR n=1 Tax=Sutterella megalosphaeroides TaxID=2494234 RepID=A0A2Z6IHC7_9BURK|nr:Rrf2 family transcriptional regulator [Sutterella megalosphaeroides]BBF24106.1 Fe-S cluster assembly transcriptional regulator IscR [Sutterella megalosphaeroides]